MENIKQLIIGIRPVTKMFRVSSVGGQLIDAILAKRDTSKILDSDYYSSVSLNSEGSVVELKGENNENKLRIEHDNILFSKGNYRSKQSYDFNKYFQEFREIWKIVDSILSVKNVRRIGIACESRFETTSGTSSENLISNLTKLPVPSYTQNFAIHYETLRSTKATAIPDPEKGDYVRSITDVYDSHFDKENSQKGFINLNVDVQRFYAPVTNGNISDEVFNLYNSEFIKIVGETQRKMQKLGLWHG
jgi:uncharacterized protein (TIGR04255 family)